MQILKFKTFFFNFKIPKKKKKVKFLHIFSAKAERKHVSQKSLFDLGMFCSCLLDYRLDDALMQTFKRENLNVKQREMITCGVS